MNDEMRKIRELAAELNISERQFHRRLDAKDPAACLLLRQEILWHYGGIDFVQTRNGLNEMTDLLRRCDPELAAECDALVVKIDALRKTPPSPWQVAKQQKMLDEAKPSRKPYTPYGYT